MERQESSSDALDDADEVNEAALKLSNICTKNPHFLKENDSVLQASKLMKEKGVGVIPIVDNNHKPCGIITDRDIVIRCIAENHDYKTCKLDSVLSKNVQKVFEDQTAEEAINLMKHHQLKRLVCVDRNGKLCGLLSLSDLARHVKDNDCLGELLRQIHVEKKK
jgi:CBS domain-containing protein